MQAAERCADVIWKRGLLKAGYGLCHGVSGNAYAFLAMYQETGDVEYLQKAKRFCNFACDYGKHGCKTPDSPFSLFEGMSGTVYFLDDMEKVLDNPDKNLKKATFPTKRQEGRPFWGQTREERSPSPSRGHAKDFPTR